MQNSADEYDDSSASAAEDYPNDQNDRGKKKRVPKDEGPACQSCRKKKAKCSRRQPCSQCERYKLDCVYDEKRLKPGMRAGAIEHLTQRLNTLENMFLGQGILWQHVWRCLEAVGGQSPPDSACSVGSTAIKRVTNIQEYTSQLKETLSSIGVDNGSSPLHHPLPRLSSKRRRLDDDDDAMRVESQTRGPFFEPTGTELPPDDLVDALVEIYFERVHPWIPLLHVRQFRQRMQIPEQRRSLTSIFHAIVSLCVHFSDDPRLSSPEARSGLAKRSRQTVILQSMESFSVENLQALTICAFDTIGSGRGPSAWSIVGSMTRTAEQLQLSVEDEDQPQSARDSNALIERIAFLPPCKDWSEMEERRRVFWNVFLMDRFCSIATGWNLSLTSADVKRRLPCEGAIWEEGIPPQTPTPYFGVSDQLRDTKNAFPTPRTETEDQTSLGGFAYCIEATESLSLITSFFLQQAVNVSKAHDVQVWLMRFKQLDLRLVQWKLFLPERWQEACALNADGNMDPNLTLAHMTHNTAVVLLHQGIAYPSIDWQSTAIRLPSASSAETCLAAATEVAIIAERFLQDADFLTNPQFAFCLFICGRMLLAHASYYAIQLPSEFDSLVSSLIEVSRRWNGLGPGPGTASFSDNLASRFASRLIHARRLGPTHVDLRQAACSEDRAPVQTIHGPQDSQMSNLNSAMSGFDTADCSASTSRTQIANMTRPLDITDYEGSPDSISMAFPPLPLSFQGQTTSANQTAMASPVMSTMNHTQVMCEPSSSSYRSEETTTAVRGPDPVDTQFEDLSSFLDYLVIPNQRVSVFSQSTGKDASIKK